MSVNSGPRAYRLLLRLLPYNFRATHGKEMETVFQDNLSDARAKGRIAWAMAWLKGSVDVVVTAGRRWSRGLPGRRPWKASVTGPSSASVYEWLVDVGQDVRYALRGLAKAKAFTVIAVLSLAVGIGVNTTLFTVVHSTMFRPVPGVTGADRIVEVLSTESGREFQEWTYPDFLDVRAAETPIEELAGWKMRIGNFGGVDGGQPVNLMYVSANYFRVLGVSPSLGRGFLSGEDVVPGGHKVAVVSYRMWQTKLDSDQHVIGRTITVNRNAYTIVGVTPEAFRGHRPLVGGVAGEPDVWLPLTENPLMLVAHSMAEDRESMWMLTLGRLRDGATVDEANAALHTVFTRLALAYPESNEDRGARAASFGPFPAMNRTADLLAAGGMVVLVGLVLLVICSNLAGMVLARSATRERELAVRLALGSGRGRLVRQLMVEALVLAIVGGGAGILLAHWATGLASSGGLGLPVPAAGWEVDGPILVYSLVLTLGTTLVFGLFPALRFSRPELVASLKDDTGGGARRVGRIHRLAAGAQTGIALILLVVCSLFFRAVGLMNQRDLGFEPENLFVAHIDLTAEGYDDPEQGEAFIDRVIESVGATPGVATVAVANGIPLDLIGNFTSVSRTDLPEEQSGTVRVEFTGATEGFFPAIGASILQGRGFQVTDKASTVPVVVVTKSLADRLWPGEQPLGRQLRVPLYREYSQIYTVVGVVQDVASSVATRDIPHVFVSLRQRYHPQLMIVLRANADLGGLGQSLRDAILAIDPQLPAPSLVASTSLVRRSTEAQRGTAMIAAGLGALVLLLSAIGVYGVVAFMVANRTREIGLRMAMGATRGQVLRGVLWDAIRLAVPGLAAGGLLAVAVATAMRSELLGLSPVDPVSFSAAVVALLMLVLLASFIPARRASAVDPLDALRSS
jgi:predicted permease